MIATRYSRAASLWARQCLLGGSGQNVRVRADKNCPLSALPAIPAGGASVERYLRGDTFSGAPLGPRFFLAAAGGKVEDVCGPSFKGLALLGDIGRVIVDPGDGALVPRNVIEDRLDDVRVGHAELVKPG